MYEYGGMAKTQARPHQKHVPQRTCVSCGQVKPKWELVRIVRTPSGLIEIDARGKKAGRGAYLCKALQCWQSGLLKKRLQRALNIEITSEQHSELLEYGSTFLSAKGEQSPQPNLEGVS